MVVDSMEDVFQTGGLQRQQQERIHRQQQKQSLSPSPPAIQDQHPAV